MKVNKLGTLFLLLCFILLFSLTVMATETEETTDSDTKENTEQKISDGVYIEDINVSGLSEEEARALVEEYINTISSKQVIITMDDKQTTVTIGELGYYWANTDIITEAFSVGKTGNIIKRFKDKKDIEKDSKVYEINYEINNDILTEKLNTYSNDYNVPHANPTIIKEGSTFKVVGDEAWGRIIDINASNEKIRNFILNEWDKENTTIDLVVVDDPPATTISDCEKVKDLLGTYTTRFSTAASSLNRNMNIKNGARLINGTVVYPGEVFSANDKVNPCTAANGYYPAGTYENGRVVDSIGGGICQVSSTLYNAVLRAELEIVQRSNHSMAVGYVPLAADAALAGTWKDFKFKNNTSIPIYIEAIYSDGKITFNLFGAETRQSGRTVEYVSETLSTTPCTEVVTQDSSKPTGYRTVTQTGHTGYVAKLWKYVYLNGAQQSVELVNTSSYQMAPTYVTIGTGPAVSTEPTQPETTQPETTPPETTPPSTDTTTQQ